MNCLEVQKTLDEKVLCLTFFVRHNLLMLGHGKRLVDKRGWPV